MFFDLLLIWIWYLMECKGATNPSFHQEFNNLRNMMTIKSKLFIVQIIMRSLKLRLTFMIIIVEEMWVMKE